MNDLRKAETRFSYQLKTTCPYCKYRFDIIKDVVDRGDNQENIANMLLGDDDSPADWSEIYYEFNCPNCENEMYIDSVDEVV